MTAPVGVAVPVRVLETVRVCVPVCDAVPETVAPGEGVPVQEAVAGPLGVVVGVALLDALTDTDAVAL